MTSSAFKERFRNHMKSFTHKKYSNETRLSKYVWHLKENNKDFTLFSFVEKPRKYIISELSIRKLGSSSMLIIPYSLKSAQHQNMEERL